MARTKSKGLGDTIAKITEATGIDKAVKFIQVKKPSTSCSDCFRDVHNELKRVMKVYEDEILHSGSES
jgi:hypothetical protein